MAQFRKKPVVIEAEQFIVGEPLPFAGHGVVQRCSCGSNEKCAMCGKDFVQTLEGPLVASNGDWIIRGVKGEFYPCKPDIFEATYEAVKG